MNEWMNGQTSTTNLFHSLIPSQLSWASTRLIKKRHSHPPSTDCSMCPLQHLRLSLLRFCWSYSLEFTAQQPAQSSCWTRPVLTEPENPPVCLLLVFRRQCSRGVFTYSHYTNVHLLTYYLLDAISLLINYQTYVYNVYRPIIFAAYKIPQTE